MIPNTKISKKEIKISGGDHKKANRFLPYAFIAPHFFFFTVFLIFPTLYGIYLSFHTWDFFGTPEFVGLQNYIYLIVDKNSLYFSYFWSAFKHTIYFVIFSVPLLIVIPLFVAIGLDAKPWGSNFFRAIFYAPSLFSIATVALIWIWMLDTNAGLVNYYLGKLGFEAIPWLTDLPWAWVSLIVMTIWWTLGSNMILFLASLQDVPTHLYEAAKIDGASVFRRFWHVTLPGIRNQMIFILIMTTIASFNIFGQPFMATKGGPGTDTKVLLMYIQEVAFTGNSEAGVASAMAILMGIVLVTVSVIQFKVINSEDKE
ncbi:carbohydrate ABC transporter permease [Lederbergia citri]|uniref:Sugar ABC transporter permease n=1 Tax=Lederbergia citri TaxID=2833580 RepID=A0A942YHM5_9BACI|nr:sugar ABC transporter permease [Lederbergia citri]MBS4195575.1 sugar ABC transporter permease [Lederbergia citri]